MFSLKGKEKEREKPSLIHFKNYLVDFAWVVKQLWFTCAGNSPDTFLLGVLLLSAYGEISLDYCMHKHELPI